MRVRRPVAWSHAIDVVSGSDGSGPRRSESEEEEEEEVIVESDDEVQQKKRKSSSKKPAPKKARTEYTIEEHEKGTIKRPTENTIKSTGAFNGEFAFALGTVCSVLCEKTNRWVTGHVIMFHRGGVTTKYAVKAVRVLFCLLYTSPSPRDRTRSRMPSSA